MVAPAEVEEAEFAVQVAGDLLVHGIIPPQYLIQNVHKTFGGTVVQELEIVTLVKI